MVLTSKDLWRLSGYGPDEPWSKEIIAQDCGTLSPYSAVVAGDYFYWWGTEGIYASTGGYGKPEIISDRIRDIVLDGVNESARNHIVGVTYRGLVIWSTPARDRTSTIRRWC